MSDVIVGADVGGSSTRVAAATLDGRVVALAEDAGGNPNAVGPALAAERIRRTTERCLSGLSGVSGPSGRLRAMVIGLAGGSRAATDPALWAAMVPSDLPVRPRLVGDLEVAFASATPAADGYVLICGTGAIAGRLSGDQVVERRDGWGWLLGDEGSGYWLGREAVRSTLRALQRGEPLEPLHRAVLAAAGADGPDALVRHCYDSPPIWLASLAVLLTEHAADPAAQQICAAAVERLAALVDSLDLVPGQPLVLAGSVATRRGPVSTALGDRLAERYANPVLRASNGVIGALWIAARSCGVTSAETHRRLVSSLAARLSAH